MVSIASVTAPARPPTEPIRAGREIGAIDKKRLKVVERLFKRAAASEAGTRPLAGTCRAASSAST